MSQKTELPPKEPAFAQPHQDEVELTDEKTPAPSRAEGCLSFNDLVIDDSLTAVAVKVKPARKRKRPVTDSGLLIELQCEV